MPLTIARLRAHAAARGILDRREGNGPMKAKWMLIVFGPALLMLIASVLVMLLLPHPVPRNATGGQRLYLTYCAACHGANGHGSWRAWLFLLRPGDLGDARLIGTRTDEYLESLIKNGGATIGKPGMPAFGYHLKDEQIRELVAYLRTLPERSRPPGSAPAR
jgi:mono/diheme cytochrome c family protein